MTADQGQPPTNARHEHHDGEHVHDHGEQGPGLPVVDHADHAPDRGEQRHGEHRHGHDDHGHDDHNHGDHGHDHSEPAHGSGLAAWWHKLSHLVTPHSHDAMDKVDSAMEASRDGIRALWISLAVLGTTAVLQAVVGGFSHSVGLLGGTLPNR